MGYPASVYDEDYHFRADGYAHWVKGKMRYGDALAAVVYAFGVPNWETIRDLFQCTQFGKESDGDERTAWHQLNALMPLFARTPKSVLDVGGGRGEVSLAFERLGVAKVQSVEPHSKAVEWYGKTAKRLYSLEAVRDTFRLVHSPIPECLPYLELEDVDTVTVVETLEHVPEAAWAEFWAAAKPALQRNKGRLVVTNWLNYHPIEVTGEEHCRRVDDAVYDWLAQGGKVAFREGSHLVVDYGQVPQEAGGR